MFLRCQTQWRATMNGVLGLDYAAVGYVLSLYAADDQRSLLEDIQTMEAAAMTVINSRAGS